MLFRKSEGDVPLCGVLILNAINSQTRSVASSNCQKMMQFSQVLFLDNDDAFHTGTLWAILLSAISISWSLESISETTTAQVDSVMALFSSRL